MEYYDSINNHLLYLHYSQRNAGILTNPEVSGILDKIDASEDSGVSANILGETPYNLVTQNKTNIENLKRNLFKKNTMLGPNGRDSITNLQIAYEAFIQSERYIPSNYGNINKDKENTMNIPQNSISDYPGHRKSNFSNISSSTRLMRKALHENVKKNTKVEMDKLDSKLITAEHMMSKELDVQKNSFEERKRKKQEKMRSKQRRSMRFKVRRGSKLDDILLAVVSQGQSEDMQQNEILKGIMKLSEKKVKKNQVLMMKEIEDYIEKNLNEMHMALEELKISFKEEIKCVDEEVFPDVVKGLKEDMEVELENLKDQYEEQRRDTVEKIKAKYNKK